MGKNLEVDNIMTHFQNMHSIIWYSMATNSAVTNNLHKMSVATNKIFLSRATTVLLAGMRSLRLLH